MKIPARPLAILLVASMLSLTGCSTATEGQPVKASEAAPTSAIQPSPSVTAKPAVAYALDMRGTPNIAVTFIGGPDAFAHYQPFLQGFDSGVEVVSRNGPFRATFLPSGSNAEPSKSSVIGIQQVPDADRLAVTANEVRIAGEGLAGETFEWQTNLYDSSGKVVERVSRKLDTKTHLISVGLFDKTVIFRGTDPARTDEKYPEQIVAVDAESGRELWKKEVTGEGSGGNIGGSPNCPQSDVVGVLSSLSFDRSPDGSVLYGDKPGLTAVDVHTGEQRWVRPTPLCYTSEPLPGGTSPYRLVSLNGVTAFNFSDGAPYATEGVTYSIDKKQNILAVSYAWVPMTGDKVMIDGNNPAFQTIDLKTGKVLFEMPATDAANHRNLDVISAFDGKVWMNSNGKQTVIDAKTGKPADDAKLTAMFGRVPLYWGDKWIVVGADLGQPATLIWKDSGDFDLSDLSLTP